MKALNIHFVVAGALPFLQPLVGSVSALDITASTDPIVQGSGVGMTARYENVATLDGTSLDVFAEVLAYSPAGKPCVFESVEDDMMFQFRGGITGMERNATVRWTFYESGTTNAVTVPNFSFTVDDLDNLPTRQESLTTSHAKGYELNNPTNVTATLAGSTVSAAGGIEQNSGDPEGAVKLHFANRSSVEISYRTIHGSALVSAYHHDGNDEFEFTDPVLTPIPPPLPRLYYTYHFTNDQSAPVDVQFFDDLPSTLEWDANYSPVTTGGLQVQVAYSNGNKDAAIDPLTLPPGHSTLTLATVEVTRGGTIDNVASLTLPNGETLVPEGGGASINLPPSGGVVGAFASSLVSTFGLTVTDQSIRFNGDDAGVVGKVAVTGNVEQLHVKGGVTGEYLVHPPLLGTIANIDTQPGDGGQPISPIYTNLTSLKTEVIALSALAAGLAPTQSFGLINLSTTITASASDGVNVVTIQELNLAGPRVLILEGGPNDYFFLNIQDSWKIAGQGNMILTGGLTPNHVIVNMLPGSTTLQFSGISGSGLGYGIFLAVHPTNNIQIGGGSVVKGSVAGRQVSISGNARIIHD